MERLERHIRRFGRVSHLIDRLAICLIVGDVFLPLPARKKLGVEVLNVVSSKKARAIRYEFTLSFNPSRAGISIQQIEPSGGGEHGCGVSAQDLPSMCSADAEDCIQVRSGTSGEPAADDPQTIDIGWSISALRAWSLS